jgi:cell division initiation protein
LKITPLDIQERQFSVRFRGFDVREVDGFLEQMAIAFSALDEENARLGEELRRSRQEIDGFRAREETLKRAMLNSQKVLEQMKENARKSAEQVVADAEARAEKMLTQAQARTAQLQEQISELKRQRAQIEVQIRGVVDAHAKMLDIAREKSRLLDEQEAKLKPV